MPLTGSGSDIEDAHPAQSAVICVSDAAAEFTTGNVAAEAGKAEYDAAADDGVCCATPSWFCELMPWIGMAPEALSSWATILKQPHLMFGFSTLAGLTTLVINTCVLLFASSPIRWDHHAPSIVYSLFHFITCVLMLRQGPAVAKTRLYNAMLVPAIFIQFAVAVRLMLGPSEQVPFGSRLLFALVNSCAIWCWAFASTTGAWAPDHPPLPFRCVISTFAMRWVSSFVHERQSCRRDCCLGRADVQCQVFCNTNSPKQTSNLLSVCVWMPCDGMKHLEGEACSHPSR